MHSKCKSILGIGIWIKESVCLWNTAVGTPKPKATDLNNCFTNQFSLGEKLESFTQVKLFNLKVEAQAQIKNCILNFFIFNPPRHISPDKITQQSGACTKAETSDDGFFLNFYGDV